MRDAAERIHDLVILALEDGFGELQLGDLLAETELDFRAGAELPHRRQDGAFFETLEIFVLLDDLVDHVHDPGADGLHQHLCAFALQEVEHVEVAVAFGGLRPEFAGDLDDRFHAQAVDIDAVEVVAAVLQRGHILVALELLHELTDILRGIAEAAQVLTHALIELPRTLLAEDLVEVIHLLVEDLIGFAGIDLVGAQRVGDFVHHVAAIQRVEDAQEEVDVHFQPGFGVGLLQTAGLLEQEHAEAIEPGITQGKAVLRFVHAEAAGTAGAGREEHVAVDDFLLRDALFFQRLEVLNQVTDGEVSGITLAVIAVFLTGLEGRNVRSGNGFGAVAETFERAVDEFLVFPRESAEEERGLSALSLGEMVFGGALEVVNFTLDDTGLLLQAGALFR